ncbi:glucan biosynthesis protein [Ahrensia sp. R2A130]|uniref:glucan biosynthesis protein n=1 Tax=Ahrensia sp. R2A130 TaxID=744979 RepID=UPI0001E0D122|nr:glucan biosynthesis protein G [Ahrensia sp. R2A130]EFL87892.1 glucans biosynthesis protein D [Ahrensia sp. R2A130]
MMNRRDILALAGLTAMLPTTVGAEGSTATVNSPKVRLGEATPFSVGELTEQVRGLAKEAYVAQPKVPQPWLDITYDQYKALNFKHLSALWRDTELPFETEFFAPGLYFPEPVQVSVVEDGQSRAVLFDIGLFDIFADDFPDLPVSDDLGFSGFRLNANINDPEHKSEFVVFQGASYFRAIGRDQNYGLSARGLALRTGDAGGEEFPLFSKFWLEKPAAGDSAVIVHALLDSPSVAGLYSFTIQPGRSTQMDVEARLFPRVELDHAGIAAGTSMFLFDETDRDRFDDFRPAVHDSDGLLIENGAGERIWRQLANPRALQISSFVDDNPRGFGLMQRPREFEDYADLEANYHKRPGLWVTPKSSWGKGAVTLVEIPADKEIYDNIVTYWRPREPMAPGSRHDFSYRLEWTDAAPVTASIAKVTRTRMGKNFDGKELAAIDFVGMDGLPDDLSKITAHVSSNGVKTSVGILQRNPTTGGARLSFTFEPGDRAAVELRAQLVVEGKQASEVWLYRWTP